MEPRWNSGSYLRNVGCLRRTAMKTRLLFAILLIIVLALILKYGAASATPFTYLAAPH
jgi:hypothetical protein